MRMRQSRPRNDEEPELKELLLAVNDDRSLLAKHVGTGRADTEVEREKVVAAQEGNTSEACNEPAIVVAMASKLPALSLLHPNFVAEAQARRFAAIVRCAARIASQTLDRQA